MLNVGMWLIMNFCLTQNDMTACPIVVGDCVAAKNRGLLSREKIRLGDRKIFTGCMNRYIQSKNGR